MVHRDDRRGAVVDAARASSHASRSADSEPSSTPGRVLSIATSRMPPTPHGEAVHARGAEVRAQRRRGRRGFRAARSTGIGRGASSSRARSYSRAEPDSATSPVTTTAWGAGRSAPTALTAAARARAAPASPGPTSTWRSVSWARRVGAIVSDPQASCRKPQSSSRARGRELVPAGVQQDHDDGVPSAAGGRGDAIACRGRLAGLDPDRATIVPEQRVPADVRRGRPGRVRLDADHPPQQAAARGRAARASPRPTPTTGCPASKMPGGVGVVGVVEAQVARFGVHPPDELGDRARPVHRKGVCGVVRRGDQRRGEHPPLGHAIADAQPERVSRDARHRRGHPERGIELPVHRRRARS